MVKDLVESPLTHVVVVMLDVDQKDKYHIIAFIIWYHEPGAGSFIPLVFIHGIIGQVQNIRLSLMVGNMPV
jgi:hypothetical protein